MIINKKNSKKHFNKIKKAPIKFYENSKSNLTKQLNLKISNKLMEKVEDYSNKFGYNNAQELIREAIRDKIHGSDNIRTEYLDKLYNSGEFTTSIGKEQSLNELEELKKRANND